MKFCLFYSDMPKVVQQAKLSLLFQPILEFLKKILHIWEDKKTRVFQYSPALVRDIITELLADSDFLICSTMAITL